MDDNEIVPLLGPRLQSDAKPCLPYRYWMCALVFVGLFNGYSLRVNFNISIVAMVNYTAVDDNYTSGDCPLSSDTRHNSSRKNQGEFDWSSHTQSQLLAAFFYGYVFLQIPGGYCSQRFGAKLILGSSILVSSLLSLLSPVAARWHPGALFAVRFLMGLAQGPIFPSNHALWSKWAPTSETTLLFSLATNGATLGTIVAPFLTGFLCSLTTLGGWPMSFYVFGMSGVVWSFFWFYFAYDSPLDCPSVSSSERQLYHDKQTTNQLSNPCPAMLYSVPIWAILVYSLLDGLATYSLFSGVPIYMKQVLHFPIVENGVMNSLPGVASFIGSVMAGVMADWLRRHRYLTTLGTRRLFTLIGEGLQGVVLVSMGFAACNWRFAVGLYILSSFLGGLSAAGCTVNILDIAPHYAGIVMGFCNVASNIGGFVSPLMVGAITNDQGKRNAWVEVFWISAGQFFIGTIVFVILATDKVQDWSRPTEESLIINVETTDQSLINQSNQSLLINPSINDSNDDH